METGSKTIYFNPAQMRSYLVRPKHEVSIIGRGGGKTTNILAPRLKYWTETMPRSSSGLLGASYMQLFTRILPGVIKGFNTMGWRENKDYWVGKYAPAQTGVPKPHKAPLKSDYIIHLKNGSLICLLSQDRPGMSNGVDLHALAVDEARYIDKKRMDEEVIPAIRGEGHLFGSLPCYQGTIFTSDMPRHASGMWLIEKKTSNESDVKLIEMGQRKIEAQYAKMSSYTRHYQVLVQSQINTRDNMLNALRARTTMVQFASSLQNINVLGKQWLLHMMDMLDDEEFQSSILTLKRIRGKRTFYPDLDWDKNGYHPRETQFVRDIGFDLTKLTERDCRMDEETEWNVNRLHIGIDSGGSFNCIVVGIEYMKSIHIINNFYLHHPGKIKDVVLLFKEYYQQYPSKRVVFHFDHTQIGKNAHSEYTVADIVTATLKSKEFGSWLVIENYLRQTPTYQYRYDMFSSLIKGTNSRYVSLRFNKLNAEQWYESCVAADVKQVGNKLEKDKSSERPDGSGNYKVSQERATHLSEAGDALVCGMIMFEDSLV